MSHFHNVPSLAFTCFMKCFSENTLLWFLPQTFSEQKDNEETTRAKTQFIYSAGKCCLWLHQAAFMRPGAAASAGSLVTPKLLVKTEVLLISNEITCAKNDIKSARIWVVSESCWDHRRAVKSFQVMQQPPAAEILQILKRNYSIKTRTSAVT